MNRVDHFPRMGTNTWTMAMLVMALTVVARVYVVEGIGVNWGTQASQTLHPRVIAQLLKDNKIDKIKLFDSDHWTVKYFAGTGIEVMLGIPNNQLEDMASSYDNAKDWVKKNVTVHLYDGGVIIKYVAVGNEPFLASYNGTNLKSTLPALKNIQRALNEEGLGGRIKATIPQNADVYNSGSDAPSAGDFRADIRDLMKEIVEFLKENDAPFLVNIYPFLSLYENLDFPLDFAFFEGTSKPVQDKQGGVSYTNMLDANLDTLVWSLRKAGASKLKIVVGEIGWPTDGTKNADTDKAKKFYDGFFKKIASKKGTPLYSGEIEYYLFSLVDENQKSIAPGLFERHWGLFRYDGTPKFAVDFTGKGNDRMPVAAKNVTYLDRRWCVYNDDIKKSDTMPANMDFACSRSDCTALGEGGSCAGLGESDRISYAFNMYFQMNNQDVEACDFQGLAKIVDKNASTGGCQFPIAIETADGAKTVVGIAAYAFVLAVVVVVLLF